ncbi:hypothetical protein V2J09_017931 [Rumex salicifolius]
MSGFRCLAEDISIDTLLYRASSIERKSSHPIADAIVYYGKSQSVDPNPEIVEDFQNFPGERIVGRIHDKEIYVGNRKLGHRVGCSGAPEIESSSEDGRSLGFVYSNGVVTGTFGLSDACRSGALDAIRDLKSMGIRTVMLTGDNNAAGIHAHDDVHAELLPEDKARILEDLKKSGPTTMKEPEGHQARLTYPEEGNPKHSLLNCNKSGRSRCGLCRPPHHGVAVLADVMTCLVVVFNSMTLVCWPHDHGSGKSNNHHHHAHGKKASCGNLSVHDHASGAHKPSCSSDNVATRRFKASNASSMEEQVAFCSARKFSIPSTS